MSSVIWQVKFEDGDVPLVEFGDGDVHSLIFYYESRKVIFNRFSIQAMYIKKKKITNSIDK